ncbi:phage tail protein [Saccharibacillus sacchari]|uniref:Tail fiber protein n=1 Tax=Saccharibacillus sacchari TaxID=456493 RepID=A0ACC6PAG5_9BACL
MSDQYLGEIRLFANSVVPQGWAPCNGQLLPVLQNQALFSLLGNKYGGDGRTNFALPNLQGRTPVHFSGNIPQGTSAGEAQHTLTPNEIPQHTHQARASNAAATATDPAGQTWAQVPSPYGTVSTLVPMHPNAIGSSGQSQPHNNMQPFLTVNFFIATQGIYPSRS